MPLKKRTPPYSHTTVHPYKTQGQINSMLEQYGICKFQWTLDLNSNIIQLVFELEYDVEGTLRKRLIKVSPSLFMEKRRSYNKVTGKHEMELSPNLAASMRMLRNWLKSRLEAITYGLFTVEDELLSQIVVNRNGQTVGERIIDQIENQNLSLEDKS